MDHVGNAKKTWDTINSLVEKCSGNKLPHYMTFQEKVLTNNQKIAKILDGYFTNIASSLTINIPQPQIPFTNYLPEPVASSLFLRPTTNWTVKTIIKSLEYLLQVLRISILL